MADEKLTGPALEAAITERGLSADGTADERRQRVADYDAAKAAREADDNGGQDGTGATITQGEGDGRDDQAPTETSADAGTQVQTGDGRADLHPPTAPEGESDYKGNDGAPIVVNSGAMTGNQVTPEHTARPIASTVDRGTESGPLEPPRDALNQTDPPQGHDLSTTDHVYASVGGRTIAGETFVGMVTEDGKPVEASAMFEDEDPNKTFVVAKQRVFEQFYYPNTTEVCKRLIYKPGEKVNRAAAERVKASIKGVEQNSTL